jgi:hypothetical protein
LAETEAGRSRSGEPEGPRAGQFQLFEVLLGALSIQTLRKEDCVLAAKVLEWHQDCCPRSPSLGRPSGSHL